MKKFVLLFTCMFVIVSMFAQTNFQDLTLEKALEKAKTENKYVFKMCIRDRILAVSRLLNPGKPEIVSLNVYKCMKKNQMHDLSWRERLRKTCLIMKLIVLLLFVTTLHLSASVYSQEARVTVHLQNASFGDGRCV